MDNNYSFLGKAVKWPIEINALGSSTLQSGLALLQQSILRILETPRGTEFFNEGYGSRLHLIGYEPNDEMLQVILDMLINEAVDQERRVKYVRTEFTRPDEMTNMIQCRIIVRALESNEIFSFVWPYYNEKPLMQ